MDGSGTTIFLNARVFDGDRVHPGPLNVVVKDSKIDSISKPENGESMPRDAKFIDAAGHTLLPGLIEAHMHAHLRPGMGSEILKPAIACGITTCLDMHNSPESVSLLKAECAKSAQLPDFKSACYGATIDGGWPKPIVLHHDSSKEVPNKSIRSTS